MHDFKLVVKNYRCFDDRTPLVVGIGSHFTALVGANNSGKSSFLKFFFEFRYLWDNLRNALPDLLQSRLANASLNGIPDPEEIFSNTNQRDLSIELELLGVSASIGNVPTITKAVVTCGRSKPGEFSLSFFSGQSEIERSSKFSWQSQHVSVVSKNGLPYRAAEFCEVLHAFATALYIGPFRNAINEGGGSYYDLAVGSSFIGSWNSWKTGTTKAQNRAVESVTSDIRQIFEYNRLEINSSQDQKTLSIYVNGKPYRLPELGAGLSQFIIVLGNAAIRRPSLILVDEPELNLHPSLQIDFLTSLASYAGQGVIFATHSIGLARSVANQIYSFQHRDGSAVVRRFEQTPHYAEFVGEMSFSVFKDMGCDRILLVEGVNDVRTMQQFLRMQQKDHKIVIIPLGGDQLARSCVEPELAELKRLTNNISALVDSERTSPECEPKRERREFQKVCERLGIELCITERRALENYFSDNAVKLAIGQNYSALAPHQALGESDHGWSKTDNWKIARCMRFEDIATSDLGKFVLSL